MSEVEGARALTGRSAVISSDESMDEFLREAVRLETNYITRRSVAVVIRDGHGNTATGTSTCVQIGGRYLLATAGHVIEDVNDKRIELIPASELSAGPLPFVARSCSPERSAPRSDVAWIELDADVVEENRLRFLDRGDLKLRQLAEDRHHPHLVHGYPEQSAILTPTSSNVASTVAVTLMAQRAELWRPLEPHEVATEYPPRDEGNHPLRVAPGAHGLSGGGVWWHPRHDETILTSPTAMKLVAINTVWDSRRSVLFASRIDEWLALVAHDFPELRDVVETSGGGDGAGGGPR